MTTVDGLMDHLVPLGYLESQVMKVETGQTIDVEAWKKRLTALGYERMAQVDGMGQFSIRGGIIDIFPLTEELPLRIELWDDEVDSIRSFDIESQRSVEQLEEALIYPATEMVLSEEQIRAGIDKIRKEAKKYEKSLREQLKTEEAARIQGIVRELTEGLEEGWHVSGRDSFLTYFYSDTVSFLEYFPADKTALFLDEPARLREKGETVEAEFRESMVHRLEKGYLLPGQTSLLFTAKETLARVQVKHGAMLTGLEQKIAGMAAENRYHIEVKNVNSYQNSFEILIKDLKRWKREKYRVILLSGSRTRASRLAGDLREYELSAFCPDDEERQVKPGGDSGHLRQSSPWF